MKKAQRTWQWKPGYKFPFSAEVAAEELERIHGANGGVLIPQMVVNESANPESPLHSFFEWDTRKAANKYRRWQARVLINRVECVVKFRGSKPHMISAFTSVIINEKRVYERTDILVQQDDTRAQILGDAYNQLVYFKKKYSSLVELATVFQAIEELEIPGMQVEQLLLASSTT